MQGNRRQMTLTMSHVCMAGILWMAVEPKKGFQNGKVLGEP